jgi:hypothetical protein
MFAACSSANDGGGSVVDAGTDATTEPSEASAVAPNDAGQPAAAMRDAGPDAADANDLPDVRAPDGGCFIRDIDYDQSCDADSDCASVQAGGNFCDIGSAGEGCLFCFWGSVNKGAEAAYLADFGNARGAINNDDYFTGSCPLTNTGPACIAHRCTFADYPDGGNAEPVAAVTGCY